MEDFSTRLMNKYPSLFYKNELGETECPCGIWVPQGWEKIIDDLCGAIKDYLTLTYRTEKEIISKKYYTWHYLYLFLSRIHPWLIKRFPKLKDIELNKSFCKLLRNVFGRANKYTKWKKIYPPQVKIDQIKEKFAELRFYVSGGDREIQGMISFAEYLCRRTCEVSGEEGEVCVRGSWYKTLSPNVLGQQPYQGYKTVK